MRFLLPKESYRTELLQVFTGGILFPAGMSWLTQVTNAGCCRCGCRGSLGRAHPSPFSGSWPRAPAWSSLPQHGSRSHRTRRRLCPPIQQERLFHVPKPPSSAQQATGKRPDQNAVSLSCWTSPVSFSHCIFQSRIYTGTKTEALAEACTTGWCFGALLPLGRSEVKETVN